MEGVYVEELAKLWPLKDEVKGEFLKYSFLSFCTNTTDFLVALSFHRLRRFL
jgi:hypothetical protein